LSNPNLFGVFRSTLHGRFDQMSGTITLDRAAKTGALDVKIMTASVTTGDAVTQFKRSDFGMKTFIGPVSDEVKMSFNIESYKA
jgi:polyisoprenoid-binding protein YceI